MLLDKAMRHPHYQILAVGFLLTALDPSARVLAQTVPVELRILAINDFHGYLRPPPGGIRIADPADKTKLSLCPPAAPSIWRRWSNSSAPDTGTHLRRRGDLIGASPFLSAMFHDEPTIESLSMMGLDVASVGNHEFDEARTSCCECRMAAVIPGTAARAASLFRREIPLSCRQHGREEHRQKRIPAYAIREIDGVPVAFIGLTLKGTAGIVSPDGITGLEFRDEAETVNALIPELKARGVEAIVVLIHEGGLPAGDYNECPGISGPIVEIVKKFDKAVDVVVSGHTHRAYVCEIDGRLVTSADKYRHPRHRC